ncbi:hypothetical protein L1D14_07470 [Vibrio tubiashii]|uniref:hypothetical protein n=1 Tax=Vibrio tubiashii TaxID=29498 RepID=UPI001EFEB40C|nr:hypothetical protein [Vibrio tubiashii]MCG9576077.1 hypothetical protein [Vibrio tubiashii]
MSEYTYQEVQNHPYSKSIADDDCCATCKHCLYAPGDLSLCKINVLEHEFPGQLDDGDVVVNCSRHQPLNTNSSNIVSLN